MPKRKTSTARQMAFDAELIRDQADELLSALLAFIRDHSGEDLPAIMGSAFPRGRAARRRDALLRAVAGSTWTIEQLMTRLTTELYLTRQTRPA